MVVVLIAVSELRAGHGGFVSAYQEHIEYGDVASVSHKRHMFLKYAAAYFFVFSDSAGILYRRTACELI